jgi:hypothetical protein
MTEEQKTVAVPQPDKAASPFGGALERWKLYRAYLQHEDELIHQRLNWMLLLQGFFFAAYASMYSGLLGSSLAKAADCQPPWTACQATPQTMSPVIQSLFPHLFLSMRTFSYVLPILGYLVALFSLFGVRAARSAIEELEAQWNEECIPGPNGESLLLYREFPLITGGGASHVQEMDSPLPFGIPIVLSGGWIALAARQLVPDAAWNDWHIWAWSLIPALPLLPPAVKLLAFAGLRMSRKAVMVGRGAYGLLLDERHRKLVKEKPHREHKGSGRFRDIRNVWPNMQNHLSRRWALIRHLYADDRRAERMRKQREADAAARLGRR